MQQELAKHLNGQGIRSGLIEEFADVYFMMYQLSVIYEFEGYDIKDIDGFIKFKADRLNKRIEKECETK